MLDEFTHRHPAESRMTCRVIEKVAVSTQRGHASRADVMAPLVERLLTLQVSFSQMSGK